MSLSRRDILKAIAALPLTAVCGSVRAEDAAKVMRINIPGPLSLPFLPIELIPILGLDQKNNIKLIIRYFPSGVRGLEDMLAGNAQFSAQGFTVLPAFYSKGKHVKAIAPLSGQIPPYAIVVRSDLRQKIRKVSDLKGRAIGISVGNITSKTYLQQLAEMFMQSYGVPANEVRWAPTAQSWDGQYGALSSRSVDAVFCEEPFVSGLVQKKIGFVLSDFSDGKVRAKLAGAGHLRATLTTTQEHLEHDAQGVEMLVRMLQQSLTWIFHASASEVVERLGIKDSEEKQNLINVLIRNRDMYASDVHFSRAQLEATTQFMRTAGLLENGNFDINSLIAGQFAGVKP